MCVSLCICFALIACGSGQIGPVVDTSVGQIIGLQDDFTKFLGIPYGVVDLNDPFGPAKTHPLFHTPYLANKDPFVCPQIFKGTLQGNIQCLHLNVYKPRKISQNRTLPVMVFIHGGAFIEGNGNLNTYSPIFLMKMDVMLVTVNYRLGPYGFLCLAQEEYRNQGLKDQSLALKWIKSNIKYFGGDEDNILLFGHSAGSASVDFHLMSNENKIFNKVILQSVQLVSPLLIDEPKNHDYIANTASKLGIDIKDLKTNDIIKKLSNVTVELVISTTKNDNFRPCVHDLVIDDNPKQNHLNDIKIMIGNVEKEMIFFYNGVINYTDIVKREINKHFPNIPETGVTRVENFYLTGDLKDNTIDFGCDFFFNYPTERSIRHYLKNNATVFRYLFSYDGGRNFIKVRDGIDAEGATHGDELGYLFDSDIFKDAITANDLVLIDTVTSYWTDFAKYGEPRPEESEMLKTGKTLEFYMNIDYIPMLHRRYRKKQMLFWDSFYKDFEEYSTGVRFAEDADFYKNRAPRLDFILTLAFLVILSGFII